MLAKRSSCTDESPQELSGFHDVGYPSGEGVEGVGAGTDDLPAQRQRVHFGTNREHPHFAPELTEARGAERVPRPHPGDGDVPSGRRRERW